MFYISTAIMLFVIEDYILTHVFNIALYRHAGFLLRAGTRVIYPAMTLHVPGYRPDGRSFFSVTSQ